MRLENKEVYSPLDSATTTRYYLLVCSKKRFHATPEGCQLLDRYIFTM